jgi:indolepyruvate decarboxylase
VIVIVLDNQGFGTQRPMLDGSFNDIPALAAEELTKVIGAGQSRLVRTEHDMDEALSAAIASDEVFIIRVVLPKLARSAGLTRLGEALAKRM